MKKIGLLSDTHSFYHPRIRGFFEDVDEIWHAGDIGDPRIAVKLGKLKPFRAVSGNIDEQEIRALYPRDLVFSCEKVKVYMTHIGGYPGRYDRHAMEVILKEKPALFICGHSHILKVIYDEKNRMLCMNPGAAGKFGMHRSITLLRFLIDGDRIRDLEVMDIPRRNTNIWQDMQ